MPNIQGYNAPAGLGLQPTETGIDAVNQTARRIGAFYNQQAEAKGRTIGLEGRELSTDIKEAGEAAVDYEDHQQISHGAATAAQMTEQLTSQWNDIAKNADPNDPTVAAKFQQDTLEPALQKFREGFWTEKSQNWAESHIDLLRQHMFEKTSADMSTLAAKAVTENARTLSNSLTNTAVMDPSSVPSLLKGLDNSISGLVDSSPNLKGTAAATAKTQLTEKIREDIVKAGAFGSIQRSTDPEAAAARWTQQYPEYINGQEALQLAKAAKSQNKVNAAEDRAATLFQKQQQVADFHAQYSKITASVLQPDGTLRAGPDYFKKMAALANHPGIGWAPEGALKAGIAFGQEVNANPRNDTNDPNVISDFNQRMLLQPNDPRALTEVQILQAKTAHQLTDKEFQFYQGARTRLAQDPSRSLAEKEFNQFIESTKRLITNANGLEAGNPALNAKFAQYQTAARDMFEEAYKRGGAPEAVKILHANEGNSIWSIIPRFQPTKEEAQAEFHDYWKGNSPNLNPIEWRSAVSNGAGDSFKARFDNPGVPRKAGETALNYLKRTRGAE